MMDVFSNFTVAVVTPRKQAKTAPKALVGRWHYTYGIPFRIQNDKDRSFDNKITEQLCKIDGIEPSTTTPCNPCKNSKHDRFNSALCELLPTSQNPNWPIHLNALEYEYDGMTNFTWDSSPNSLCLGTRFNLLVAIG